MKISICGFMMSLLLLLSSMNSGAQQDAASSPKRNKPTKLWLSGDGSILLAESSTFEKNNQIQIWDTAQQKPIGELPLTKGLNGNVLALSDDGRQVIVRRAIYEAYFMQYNEYYFLAHPGTHPDPNDDLVSCECWSLSGTSPKLTWSIPNRKSEMVVAAFQGSNVLLMRSLPVVSHDTGYLRWNTRFETCDAKGNLLRTVALKAHKDLKDCMPRALSPDGRLAVSSNNSQMLISDTRSGQPIRILQYDPSDNENPSGSFYSNGIGNIRFSIDERTVTGTNYERFDGGLNENGDRTITHRWIWDVKSGKLLWHWANDEVFSPSYAPDDPPFSPDGRAILNRVVTMDYIKQEARVQSDILEFQDVRTHKRAAFQIPRPWGENETHWRSLPNVRISGDGKVVAALDGEGNIWIQSRK